MEKNRDKKATDDLRPHMTRAQRAKQFMPFAALKGYEDVLRTKERIVVPKIELSEEKREELDRKFSCIRIGTIINVIYFSEGEYLKIEGMVSKIDLDAKYVRVVSTKIPFENIYDILIE